MVRMLACLAVITTLPACAITPPSSMFAPLSDDREAAQREPARPAKQQEQANASGSGGGIWSSVKSGLGFSKNKEEAPKPASVATKSAGAVEALNPEVAAQLINQYRSQKGLPPLRLSPKLSQAANQHSQDLANNDRISHYGSDGSDTWDRVRQSGYSARLTAENVGTGQLSIDEVFKGWQKSDVHNANLLLSDAEEMGISMVYKPDTQFKTFWTLVLGSPAS